MGGLDKSEKERGEQHPVFSPKKLPRVIQVGLRPQGSKHNFIEGRKGGGISRKKVDIQGKKQAGHTQKGEEAGAEGLGYAVFEGDDFSFLYHEETSRPLPSTRGFRSSERKQDGSEGPEKKDINPEGESREKKKLTFKKFKGKSGSDVASARRLLFLPGKADPPLIQQGRHNVPLPTKRVSKERSLGRRKVRVRYSRGGAPAPLWTVVASLIEAPRKFKGGGTLR